MPEISMTKEELKAINRLALDFDSIDTIGIVKKEHVLRVWFKTHKILSPDGETTVQSFPRFQVGYSYMGEGLTVMYNTIDKVQEDYDFETEETNIVVLSTVEDVQEFVRSKLTDVHTKYMNLIQEGYKVETPIEDSTPKVTEDSFAYLEKLLTDRDIEGYILSLNGSKIAFRLNKNNKYRKCEYEYCMGEVTKKAYRRNSVASVVTKFEYTLGHHQVFLEDMLARNNVK